MNFLGRTHTNVYSSHRAYQGQNQVRIPPGFRLANQWADWVCVESMNERLCRVLKDSKATVYRKVHTSPGGESQLLQPRVPCMISRQLREEDTLYSLEIVTICITLEWGSCQLVTSDTFKVFGSFFHSVLSLVLSFFLSQSYELTFFLQEWMFRGNGCSTP